MMLKEVRLGRRLLRLTQTQKKNITSERRKEQAWYDGTHGRKRCTWPANFSLVSVIRRWSSARELGIEMFYGVRVVQRIKKNVGIKDIRKAYCVSRRCRRMPGLLI